MKFSNKMVALSTAIATLVLTGCVSSNSDGSRIRNVSTVINTPVILSQSMRLPCSETGELSYQKLVELGRVTVPPKNGKLSFQKVRTIDSRSCGGKVMTFSKMIYTPNTGFIGDDTLTLSQRWIYNISITSQ